MTRIVTGQDIIHKTELTYTPERIWWSVQGVAIAPLAPFIQVSDLIPDGTVVHEVQIQAVADASRNTTQIQVYLSAIMSRTASDIDIQTGERIIKWDWNRGNFLWSGIGNPINERWPCRKTLHGAGLRFAVAMVSADPLFIDCRVSVLYSPG